MRKFIGIAMVMAISLTLVLGLAACGGSTGESAGTDVTTAAATDNQGGTSAAVSETTAADAKAASGETEVAAETLPTADSKTSVDALIGNWADVNDDSSFVKITKTDAGYQMEDNDSKYPATFENGVLKVKASDTDTAEVYIDPDTGHLLVSFQGGVSEYMKK